MKCAKMITLSSVLLMFGLAFSFLPVQVTSATTENPQAALCNDFLQRFNALNDSVFADYSPGSTDPVFVEANVSAAQDLLAQAQGFSSFMDSADISLLPADLQGTFQDIRTKAAKLSRVCEQDLSVRQNELALVNTDPGTAAYQSAATQFDAAVNAMIADAQGSTPQTSGSGTTVNTAVLTTDGLVVQAKQSLRDTISGATNTVLQTLKKLAQQLGQ